MPAPVTSKGERSAAELKAAALRVIARQGYLSTKIADITAEAGKSAGVFYRYFTDKDDLLRSVVDDFAVALRERVTEQAGGPHALDGVEDVRGHVRAYWDTYCAHRAEMTGIYEASLVSAEFAAHWEGMRARHVDIWTAHVAEARDLAAPDRDTRLTALAVVAMIERFCQLAAPAESEEEGDAAVEAMTRLLAHGLLRPEQPN
ncbi:TetR/AcrR family transcriptional regulator [Streptomyces pseudovenezuelae]|uniref:AcrR family transcriptional regulator n=1 Tax=Streptomyces pseudovenezuelae TaxID=67350 RepID=A0ABT6LD42_9ACTN|nr:TetR/AcrR family transcriptional regulator [Streptomyces pseudovenezuelae]MDH6214233.1 AcrR family transcriptional regulator [Streptomyces pseudovenezuelae]